jgi:hypothetical protein
MATAVSNRLAIGMHDHGKLLGARFLFGTGIEEQIGDFWAVFVGFKPPVNNS